MPVKAKKKQAKPKIKNTVRSSVVRSVPHRFISPPPTFLEDVGTVEIKIIKKIHVLKPKRSVTECGTEYFLDAELAKLIEQGARYIILDMSQSRFVGSSLGVLVNLYDKLRNLGGSIRLCCLTKYDVDKLHLTKLDRLFTRFYSVQEAVESFKQEFLV